MRLVKPSCTILDPVGYTIKDIYKSIELASRTCYKSESYITEDSAEKFVNMIKDRQHNAMLEHGTVYLKIVWDTGRDKIAENYSHNKYSKMKMVLDKKSLCPVYYITTNYRVLVENGWLDDLKYLCEPTEHHEKRITVHFVCDREISHELVRHKIILCVT